MILILSKPWCSSSIRVYKVLGGEKYTTCCHFCPHRATFTWTTWIGDWIRKSCCPLPSLSLTSLHGHLSNLTHLHFPKFCNLLDLHWSNPGYTWTWLYTTACITLALGLLRKKKYKETFSERSTWKYQSSVLLVSKLVRQFINSPVTSIASTISGRTGCHQHKNWMKFHFCWRYGRGKACRY